MQTPPFMERRTAAGPRGWTARWTRLALSLLALALVSACVRQATFRQVEPLPNGEASLKLDQPGLNRILIHRARGMAPWKTLLLRNAGPSAIREIRFWGLGGTDLFRPLAGQGAAPGDYKSFTLLPDEQFSCSAIGEAREQRLLSGIFLWQAPRDVTRLRRCLTRLQNAQIESNGALALRPGGGEAYIELAFDSPLPHKSAHLAWRLASAEATPQVWVNVNGDAWARVPPPRLKADWLHPVDLTTAVAGSRRFLVRIAYEVPHEGPGNRSPALQSLLNQLRVEREVQAPGTLRDWRNGVNEISVSLTASPPPLLEMHLMALQ